MKLWKVNHQLDHNKYLSQQKVCKTYVCKTHVKSYKSNSYIDQNLWWDLPIFPRMAGKLDMVERKLFLLLSWKKWHLSSHPIFPTFEERWAGRNSMIEFIKHIFNCDLFPHNLAEVKQFGCVSWRIYRSTLDLDSFIHVSPTRL